MLFRRAALLLFATALCDAQAAQPFTVATFGGSFAEDTKTCIVQPFDKANGVTTAIQLGNSVQIAAAIRATGGRPTYDVAYMDNSLATQLQNEGLLEPLDTAKMASFKEVDPKAFGPGIFYVAFEVSSTAIVYDPKVVKVPPTSWNDLFDPKYRGRMALGDITGTSGIQTMLAVNRMNGGTLEHTEPGFAAMKRLVPDAVTLYTQADQLLSLFQRGDVVIAPWYPDRAGSAMDKGLSLAVAYPKEGAVGIKPTLVIPRGAANPELALKYVDAVLSRDAQACFTERQYAAPVNMTVKLTEKVAKIVASGEDYERLWFPDPTAVATHLPEWIRRWQREVAR